MTDSPRPQRRMMLLLLAVFFLPLAASFVLYYGVKWRPAGNSSHGELLQPMQQLPAGLAASLQEKWALVYVGDARCDSDCQDALVDSRAARLLLNKDMVRVNRALLATDGCCDNPYLAEEHEGLMVIDASEPAARAQLLAVLPADQLQTSVFVVDPIGNIVLRFDAREDPKGLLSDLKKLLKLSHIG